MTVREVQLTITDVILFVNKHNKIFCFAQSIAYYNYFYSFTNHQEDYLPNHEKFSDLSFFIIFF